MGALRVGVIGASGRMGREVCSAVEDDKDLELVCRIGRGDSLDLLAEASADVAVDFTTPQAVAENVAWLIDHDIRAVVGTTGLDDQTLTELGHRAEEAKVGVFVAPNFAVGAVLMMRFAAIAAPYFRGAEIIERHHERKLDAPSGTALRTAWLMNRSRDKPWEEQPGSETPAPSRGREEGGVRIHSLRLPGSVAHQEVVLGATGETLTIRHDSVDRSSFIPGVLLAVKKVSDLTGVVVGLENLLDL